MIKLEVSTHSGDADIIQVTEYNEIELNEKRNTADLESVLIGRNSYSRVDLKNIRVLEEDIG